MTMPNNYMSLYELQQRLQSLADKAALNGVNSKDYLVYFNTSNTLGCLVPEETISGEETATMFFDLEELNP